MSMQMELVSNMTGVPVRNPAGDELGVVADVLVELQPASEVGTYVIVAFGGTLGVGQRSYAVPLDMVVADVEGHCFVLDTTVENIRAAPPFTPDDYTVFGADEALNTLRDYYLRS